MRTRVVNLSHREDRREAFKAANADKLLGRDWQFVSAVNGSMLNYKALQVMGFDTDHNWRDPLLKRTLTLGEIGCFLSHWKLWEECADSNETMLVLEDDAVLDEVFDESWLDGDLTYLTHNEMLKNGVVGNLVCYPYWTAAYIITPQAAEKFLNSGVDNAIIPVDEFMPRMTDQVIMTFNTKAHQRKRSEVGTDVEPRGHKDFLRDFEVHNLTCYDDKDKALRLLKTNPDVVNTIDGPWVGGTMQGPGGGQKLNSVLNYVKSHDLPDHDIIVFTDANDVFWTKIVDEAVGRFLEMKTEFLVAAEQFKWPDPDLRFPPSETKYRYLNSGCFIARVGEFKRMMDYAPLANHEDDQLFMQKAFLSGRFGMSLDYEHYIFMTNEDKAEIKSGHIYNPVTRCFPCLYHGNGGGEAKKKFERMFTAHYPELKYANLEVKDYKVIGNEMLLVDFMTPSQCEEWIRTGEENGNWMAHTADKFPSHDIHLKDVGLWDEAEGWWSKIAARVFEDYWRPTRNYHLRKAFLMKYSHDTQKTLGLHTDASLVTGSVKLNDDYEGATLIFPRQGVTNKDIPVGKMILFPSSVTHGHFVDPLVSGTKFSATFWSARYKGDYLNPE